MSKEEESVFDKINRVLTGVDESLKLCTEVLTVMAIEMYEARREVTKLLEQIKDGVDKIAGKPRETWEETPEEAKKTEEYKALVFPKSALPSAEEETE